MSLRAVAGLIVAVVLAGAARADLSGAEVVALQGHATADAATLAVGDPVAVGSVVRTGADSRVGLFASEIYVQLDPQSAVRLERDATGRVKMTLQEGRARIIDTRGKGAVPGNLLVGNADSTVDGGDAEVYVLNEKAGRYAMFCNWTGPVHVTRDPGSLGADPGHCILAKPHEPLYAASGHDHQIPLLPLPYDAVLFDSPANHFDTTDVAAGPPGAAFGDPIVPMGLSRSPCDTPGSGCKTGNGVNIIEPPPDTGGCAPGVTCGGVTPPPPAPVSEVAPPAPPAPVPVSTGGPAGCGPGGRRGR